MKFLLSFIFILLLTAFSSAQCYTTQNYGYGYNYNQYYYPPKQIQVQLIEIPLYTAVYNPNSVNDPFQTEKLISELKSLKESIKSLNLTVKNQQNVGFNLLGQEKTEQENRFVTVLSNRCMTCHGDTKPKGGFKIFDKDNNVALTSDNLLKVINRAYVKKDMPPGNPLSQQERNDILEGVNTFLNGGKNE